MFADPITIRLFYDKLILEHLKHAHLRFRQYWQQRVDTLTPALGAVLNVPQFGTASLVYTFLGDSHCGAVEWREPGSR